MNAKQRYVERNCSAALPLFSQYLGLPPSSSLRQEAVIRAQAWCKKYLNRNREISSDLFISSGVIKLERTELEKRLAEERKKKIIEAENAEWASAPKLDK